MPPTTVPPTTVPPTTTTVPPVQPQAPPNNAPVGQLLLWKVDRRNFGLFGYALDPDTTAPVQVAVVMEGVGTTVVDATFPWDGVEQRHPGYGTRHGFLYLKADVPPGERTVCAYALDAQGGPGTALGCTRITVK